ncbi:hypothetical protein J3R83DRAFT_8692 [Lanmaoa asiatica]|nr:hypothetical protein J3R83DRAFT_8692 [Lanmaoa asiatica]
MADTVCVAGCSCIVCTRRSVYIGSLTLGSQFIFCHRTLVMQQITHAPPQDPAHEGMFTVRCLLRVASWKCCTHRRIWVLLPLFLIPPSYFLGDTHPSTARGNHRERTERTPPISSTTTTVGGTLVPSGHHDPLFEAPSLTGVPSPGNPPGRDPAGEPTSPVVGLGIDVLEEAEPPPAYSRFDESRSRIPVVSDVLGPYPHISVLNQPAQ